MAAVIFIRSLTQKCNAIGCCSSILRSNGVKLPPQMSRAFAIASFKNSLSDSKSLHSLNASASSNLLNKEAKVQTSMSRASSSGDHVRLWTAERVVSATLLAFIPAAVLIPSPTMETLLALSLTLHSHWGIEAIVQDYVRPSYFGDKIPKLAVATVTGISILTFGGLCYFIWADVGIITAISMIWTL